MSRIHTVPTRRPLPPEDLLHVTHCLKRRVLVQQILIAFMFLFGIPLLVVGPFLCTGMIWGLHAKFTLNFLPWWPLFWTSVLIVIPLSFWLEIRTNGKFGEQAVQDYGGMGGVDMMTSRGAGAEIILFVIFSLLGPGLILGAYRRLRGQIEHQAAPMDRCAEVAGQLLLAEVGVDIFSLQKSGETFEELLTVVEYLVHYDWAGVGHGGKRVWILTDAKKPLTRGS